MFVGRPTNIYHLSPVVEEAAGEEALAVVLRVHGCSEGGAHTLAGNVAQRGERREPHPMLGVDQRAGQRRDPGGVHLRGGGDEAEGVGRDLAGVYRSRHERGGERRHRARRAGVSKYSNWGRLKRTVFDLIAVRWLKSRSRIYGMEVLK